MDPKLHSPRTLNYCWRPHYFSYFHIILSVIAAVLKKIVPLLFSKSKSHDYKSPPVSLHGFAILLHQIVRNAKITGQFPGNLGILKAKNDFFQNPTQEKTQISQKSGLRPSKLINNGPFEAMKTSKSIFQLLSTISNALIHVTGATTNQDSALQNQLKYKTPAFQRTKASSSMRLHHLSIFLSLFLTTNKHTSTIKIHQLPRNQVAMLQILATPSPNSIDQRSLEANTLIVQHHHPDSKNQFTVNLQK